MQFFETIAHLFHPRRSNNHRPRVLHPEALAYLLVIALVFGSLLHTSPRLLGSFESVLGFASNITVDQVISLTNSERARLGLSPVVYSPVLSSAAEAKGTDMFAEQYWAHTSPKGKEPWAFISEAGYSYRVAGENLARDFAVSNQVVAAWMASPTHRANIVNQSYTEIGVAVVDGELEGVETTLVVQMFGTPRAEVAQVLPPATATSSPGDAESTLTALGSTTDQVQPGSPNELSSAAPVDPNLSTESLGQDEQTDVSILPVENSGSVTLGGMVVPESVLASPLISPLQITKAFFLSMLLLLVGTLCYDLALAESRKTVRFVGKNLAHIMLFSLVAFLIVFFKGGVVG